MSCFVILSQNCCFLLSNESIIITSIPIVLLWLDPRFVIENNLVSILNRFCALRICKHLHEMIFFRSVKAQFWKLNFTLHGDFKIKETCCPGWHLGSSFVVKRSVLYKMDAFFRLSTLLRQIQSPGKPQISFLKTSKELEPFGCW